MAANKTSAIATDEPVDILFALHDKFDFLDFAGPLQVFTEAAHNFKDAGKPHTTQLALSAPSFPSPVD